MRIITPIRAITPIAVSVIIHPRATPVSANGMENMMTNGLIRDSNCDAITI